MHGMPCLYLSGSGTALDAGGGPAYTRRTIVMVLKYDPCNCQGACGVAVNYLWDWRDDWGDTYVYGAHGSCGGGIWCGGSRWMNGASSPIGSAQCSALQSTTYHTTAPTVMVWEASGTNSGDDITLFARYTFGENSRARVGEVHVYSGQLPTAQRQSLECHLAAKWGVGISADAHACA